MWSFRGIRLSTLLRKVLILLVYSYILRYVWWKSAQESSDKGDIYEKRLVHLTNMCKILRFNMTKIKQLELPRTQFVVDEDDKLIWVKIEKCGCNSLFSYFKLYRQQRKEILSFVDGKLKEPLTKELKYYPLLFDKNYSHIIFVRNPFSRLLSAYKDKIEPRRPRKGKLKVLIPLRRFIRRKYRNATSANKNNQVTFQEFVYYILDGGYLKNSHWIPQHLRSLSCFVNYSVVGKVETFFQDLDYIGKRFNLPKIPHVWKYKSPNKPGKDTKYYFSQITQNDLQRLYKLYEPDFLLFNYTMDPFDKLVRKNS